MGINPGSAIKVIDRYGERETKWFIEELEKQENIQSIIKNLNDVNKMVVAHSTGTKSGNTSYTKWRRHQLEDLEEIRRVKTVFERLKLTGNGKTVFGKLKQLDRS